MNCTSLTMAWTSRPPCLLGMPSLADSIAPGILLPKKNTKSISFSPKGTSDIFLLGHHAAGKFRQERGIRSLGGLPHTGQ